MSKTKIEKYIEIVEKDFVLAYEAETENLIANKQEAFKRTEEELKHKTLEAALKEQKETLATTKQALEFEAKSKGEALKSLMIEKIYHDVFMNIKDLKGEELLEFVAALLKAESLKGEHRLLVRKMNFDKFNHALTKKDNCDLLNAKISGAKFKLEIYDDAVEEGFIIEDDQYDLYFDFHNLVEKHKEAHAFSVYQQLFGDK